MQIEGIVIAFVMLIISLWWVAILLHDDIRHLEILARQIDETLNNKL